jgi:hypothetical protein
MLIVNINVLNARIGSFPDESLKKKIKHSRQYGTTTFMHWIFM